MVKKRVDLIWRSFMKGIGSISEFIDNLEMVNTESKRMPPEQVELKEVIELFVNTTFPSIQSESEVPKFNIIFSKFISKV